ncbi:hypothetical protein N9A28_06285 [Sulfurimonas sp.]|nr:hypothetical protein [Sulfurimonas sp.]
MNLRYVFFFILGLDAISLLLKIDELSISHYEAALLYGELSFLQLLLKVSIILFGQNDFALRLPMLIFHTLSILLVYKISKNYLQIQRNRIWLTIIFILLPGVMSSAIIVNDAGLILFGLLLFVYIYEKSSNITTYTLLLIYMLISGGFAYLFISLIVYSIYKKDRNFLLFNITLLLVSLFLYGIDTHGTPKGHLLDSIAIYAAIFTPIVFVYLFYVLYRRYLTKELDLIWFISFSVLVLSLMLSFRQKVNLEYLAPYLLIALPLVAQTFEHSYRVRLKGFRKKYKLTFIISLLFLLVNSSVIFFNKYLYIIIDKPHKHFSHKLHIAKELASDLKSDGISCISSTEKMSDRLKFYGVTKCNKYILHENNKIYDQSNNVTISYKDRLVYSANVTKVNIN